MMSTVDYKMASNVALLEELVVAAGQCTAPASAAKFLGNLALLLAKLIYVKCKKWQKYQDLKWLPGLLVALHKIKSPQAELALRFLVSAATSGRIITYSTRESDTSQVLDGCLAVETALGPAAMAVSPSLLKLSSWCLAESVARIGRAPVEPQDWSKPCPAQCSDASNLCAACFAIKRGRPP